MLLNMEEFHYQQIVRQAVAATEIFILGYSTWVWRNGSPPVGYPGTGSGGRSTPEAEAVCRRCLQILTAETIKI